MTRRQQDGAFQPPVLISLAAYGADLARHDGQAALARIAAAAGADGVEYRGELQRGHRDEVSEQRAVERGEVEAAAFAPEAFGARPDHA